MGETVAPEVSPCAGVPHKMFTDRQIAQLLAAIHPRRVLSANGHSHVSQQDVRAHLTRIFGFGMWEKRVLESRLIDAREVKWTKNNTEKTGWDVTYFCRLRLRVYSPFDRSVYWEGEDVATATASHQPDLGSAHDLAAKSSVSYALKRCATDLGDQFGLSLYNKGQTEALVIGLYEPGLRPHRPEEDTPAVQGDLQEQVPQQVSLGHDDEGSRQDVDETTGEVRQQTADAVRQAAEATLPCKGCGKPTPVAALRYGVCSKTCHEKVVAEQQAAEQQPAEEQPTLPQEPPPAAPRGRGSRKAADAPQSAPEPVPAGGWPPVRQPPDAGDPSYHDGEGQ